MLGLLCEEKFYGFYHLWYNVIADVCNTQKDFKYTHRIQYDFWDLFKSVCPPCFLILNVKIANFWDILITSATPTYFDSKTGGIKNCLHQTTSPITLYLKSSDMNNCMVVPRPCSTITFSFASDSRRPFFLYWTYLYYTLTLHLKLIEKT